MTRSRQQDGGRLARWVPAAAWLGSYRRDWLTPDIVAGATAAAVVIPQAMGYATVAGLPVQIGLYTCIFPMVVYALLGGSRRLSFSTTSTIVALTGLALVTAGVSGDDAVATVTTLTLLVGAFLLVFRLIHLGWVVEAVSEAVITGLKVGVGLTIIADQLPRLSGIAPVDGGFVADVRNALSSGGDAHAVTVVVSACTIAGLFAFRKWVPRVPGPLVALAAGIVLVAFFGLADRGVELIPEVPTGLPLPGVPPLAHLDVLWPFALAIALMAYFESVTAARIARRPDDPPLDNEREYVAVGIATVAGAFFQSVPPAGGFSQTQVNSNAGARTQLSELVTASLAVLVALFLAPVLSDLPEATLGAIVVVAVAGLIDLAEFRRLAVVSKAELSIAVVTALVALLANLLVGVVVGVVLTLYYVMHTLNHPVVVELRRQDGGTDWLPARDRDEILPGLLVLRVEGGMYTQNIHRIQERIYDEVDGREETPDVLVLDVGGTADTSVTVMDVIMETDHRLARQGTELWVAAVPVRAREKATRLAAWEDWTAQGKIHVSVAAAVAAYERRG